MRISRLSDISASRALSTGVFAGYDSSVSPPPRAGNPETWLAGPAGRNVLLVSPIPGTSWSRPLPPSAIAGHAAIKTCSTDAVLEVHPAWPLPERAPNPATPREPHPAPKLPSTLLPDNFSPVSTHPADPFSRDPWLSPAPRWVPPPRIWPPSESVANTARSLLDPPHNKTATAPRVPVSSPASESILRDSVLSPAT